MHELLVSYHLGDVWAPRVDQSEELTAAVRCPVECLEKNQKPFNDGVASLDVMRMLMVAGRSLS
jgi:hypothetical protein